MIPIYPQPYFRLLRKLAFYWKPVSQSLLAALIAAAAVSLAPVFIQVMLDGAFVQKDPVLLQTALLTIIALSVARAIAGFYGALSMLKAGGKLEIDLYRAFFDKLLTLPANAYTHLREDRQIEAQIFAIRHIMQSTVRLIAGSAQDCLIIAGLAICLLYLNRELLLLLLFVAPFMVLIVSAVRDHFDIPSQKIASRTKELIDRLSQSIANYRVIKVDRGYGCESERLGKISESISQAETQQALAKAAAISAGQIATTLILCALGYITVLQTMNSTLSLTAAGATLTAILLLILPVLRLINLPRQLTHDQKILETVFTFIDQPSEQYAGAHSMPRTNCKLVFEDVRFDRTAKTGSIQDFINLTVMPGEVVVFKGYDTDKKSALIDLLLRLKLPSSGKIFLGEHLLNEINLNDLYANIMLLPAEPLLLDDKIVGNIAYGTTRCAHEAEITAAARNSDAMAFIRKMPGGLQTPIGEKGVEITRRQLQFLAIARALVKNAPLLILDEFPTMQDPDAEILLSALERLMQNRTTLIFSRQIPPLKKIDRIIE